jgi:6-phosphogluconolactonase
MPAKPEIRVMNSPVEVFEAAASEFSTLAVSAVNARGRFTVALSGGSTPKSLYALLASGSISVPWDKTYFFFGDERHVPPDDPESNFRMTRETGLLTRVPDGNVFRVLAEETDADAAARSYEQTLRQFFSVRAGEFPRFDLVLLGLGPDGHTASLFPGTAALNENSRLVVANWVEKFQTYRITLTLPVLNRAACVTFLVCGADKAGMVREVLQDDQANLPSQKVLPVDGRLLWLMDRAAASALSRKP